ncbi:MAG: carboxypeptidase regulatory-like domain-containing protein, partial [Planctomycetaceae bacterium]
MLVGYASNERYVAVPNVLFEFRSKTGQVTTATSTISGTVYAEIEPGEYEVVLGRDGYGSKIITINVSTDSPYQF